MKTTRWHHETKQFLNPTDDRIVAQDHAEDQRWAANIKESTRRILKLRAEADQYRAQMQG